MKKSIKIPTLPELKKKLKPIIVQFDRDAILFALILFGILGYGLFKFIVPGSFEIMEKWKILSEKKEALQMMEKRFALRTEKKVVKKAEIPIEIYKTGYKGISVENAGSEIANKILTIIKKSGKNTIKSLKFEEKTLVDKLGIKSENHFALRMNIQMETSYDAIQKIVNEIYLMDYLVKIQSISLSVNKESNYETAKAYLVFDIYIEK